MYLSGAIDEVVQYVPVCCYRRGCAVCTRLLLWMRLCGIYLSADVDVHVWCYNETVWCLLVRCCDWGCAVFIYLLLWMGLCIMYLFAAVDEAVQYVLCCFCGWGTVCTFCCGWNCNLCRFAAVYDVQLIHASCCEWGCAVCTCLLLWVRSCSMCLSVAGGER